jgi:hypothetical protein
MKFYLSLAATCILITAVGYYGYYLHYYGNVVLYYIGAIVVLLVAVALLSRLRPARL